MPVLIPGSPMNNGDTASASYLNNWMSTTVLKATSGLTVVGNTSGASSNTQDITLGSGLSFGSGSLDLPFKPVSSSTDFSTSTSTSISAVPGMTVNLPSSGFYAYQCAVQMTCLAPSSAGYRFALSGTASVTTYQGGMYQLTAGSPGAFIDQGNNLAAAGTLFYTTSSLQVQMFTTGIIKATGSGTYGFFAAQANSSSTPTVIKAGSYFHLMAM